jgi:hypothetical protein
MHGATAGVVTVDQRVCQGFPEGRLRVSGNRYTQQPEVDLFLGIASPEPGEHLLGQPQERMRQEVIDLYVETA